VLNDIHLPTSVNTRGFVIVGLSCVFIVAFIDGINIYYLYTEMSHTAQSVFIYMSTRNPIVLCLWTTCECENT